MRVVQIIDSLEIGGAERMAVNYANALSKKIDFSGLVATRAEGLLLHQLDKNVPYLFLNRRKIVDLKSVFLLRKFIKKNKIDVLHAHSSSFFIASLVKITFPKIKIVWHDHYGNRARESKKHHRMLVFLSFFFSKIFAANHELKKWSELNLNCHKVVFVPNFIIKETNFTLQNTYLKGSQGKRIILLANLKNPKNHFKILKAFFDLKLHKDNWSLHFAGRDYLDLYSETLKDFIKTNDLDGHVFFYGVISDVDFVLSQCSIGVLASAYEGFPVSLIEYGFSNLAVLSTNSGYCQQIIEDGKTGLLFDPENENELFSQFQKITQNEGLRLILAEELKGSVVGMYSENNILEAVLVEYLKIIR
ncbi:glycosyltransferase [Flavobacterium anhuiense]|uniref:glycosyltransferase n=1 Tax=Flavobacterium anhuiense TaxID=459526 RepID=UPI003D99810A